MYFYQGHLKFYKLFILSEVSDPFIYSLPEIIARCIIIPAGTNWFHRLFFQLRNKQEMMKAAGKKAFLKTFPSPNLKNQNGRWTIYVTIAKLFSWEASRQMIVLLQQSIEVSGQYKNHECWLRCLSKLKPMLSYTVSSPFLTFIDQGLLPMCQIYQKSSGGFTGTSNWWVPLTSGVLA